MRIIVTAGPTREPIDSVRFITNASSGKMGYAIAEAAVSSGHDVTLMIGPVCLDPPAGCRVERFVQACQLQSLLERHFAGCDALVMSAAVGDFKSARPMEGKMRRSAGPVRLELVPTPDILAAVALKKKPTQIVVSFAVEEGSARQVEQSARAKMLSKHADLIVANMPQAIGSDEGLACMLDSAGIVLPWLNRSKTQLAREIVKVISMKGR